MIPSTASQYAGIKIHSKGTSGAVCPMITGCREGSVGGSVGCKTAS